MPYSGISRLTARQKDCLRLIAQGYRSKQIASILKLSPNTVDSYVRVALQKLGAQDRSSAAHLLAAYEADTPPQKLRSQTPDLAEPVLETNSASTTQPQETRRPLRFLPPIGGAANDLRQLETLTTIGRVAFFSALTFIACVLIIKVGLSAFH